MGQYLLIPIFSGMNIHLPDILMFTRGSRFWSTAKWRHGCPIVNGRMNQGWESPLCGRLAVCQTGASTWLALPRWLEGSGAFIPHG
jgi:hypothetical protein